VPVRELQKRGWLPDTKDIDTLEAAVCDLVRIDAPTERPVLAAAARRANAGARLTPEQRAWIARVRSVGEQSQVAPLDLGSLAKLADELAGRLRTPTDLGALHDWLSEVGVALVIELPLKASKIDGVVMVAADGTPIIGLSTRGDRMDGFVFTLVHEIAHLVLGHVAVGDTHLDEDILANEGSGREVEANERAAQWVLPSELDLGPTKPTMPRIIATAQAIGVHPSLIIGRLQREGVLEWSDFRRSIPKVRPFVRIG
jgi:HTH-type transcriptional regulator/antitoxin HigA